MFEQQIKCLILFTTHVVFQLCIFSTCLVSQRWAYFPSAMTLVGLAFNTNFTADSVSTLTCKTTVPLQNGKFYIMLHFTALPNNNVIVNFHFFPFTLTFKDFFHSIAPPLVKGLVHANYTQTHFHIFPPTKWYFAVQITLALFAFWDIHRFLSLPRNNMPFTTCPSWHNSPVSGW